MRMFVRLVVPVGLLFVLLSALKSMVPDPAVAVAPPQASGPGYAIVSMKCERVMSDLNFPVTLEVVITTTSTQPTRSTLTATVDFLDRDGFRLVDATVEQRFPLNGGRHWFRGAAPEPTTHCRLTLTDDGGEVIDLGGPSAVALRGPPAR
jgi:hypothetical protein